MRFCKYCGRELADDEVCGCRPAMTVHQVPEYSAADIKAVAYKNKRQLIIGAVCIFIMVFAFVWILVFLFRGGSQESLVRTNNKNYQKPVYNFVSAYNKSNGEKMLKCMLTSDCIDNMKKDLGIEWEDHLDALSEYIGDEKDKYEYDYGKNIMLSVEFLDKKNVKHSELETIKEFYEDRFDILGIQEAYKIKVEFRIEGSEDYDIDKYWLYVVEIKGDGWLLCPYGDVYKPGRYIGLKIK